jgi:hypothetical protein
LIKNLFLKLNWKNYYLFTADKSKAIILRAEEGVPIEKGKMFLILQTEINQSILAVRLK